MQNDVFPPLNVVTARAVLLLLPAATHAQRGGRPQGEVNMAAKKNTTKPTTSKGKKAKPAPPAVPAAEHGNRGNPSAEPVANVAKKPGAGVQLASTAAAGVATRGTVHGVSVCAM